MRVLNKFSQISLISIIILLIADIAILLDLPPIRQIFAFILLSIVPGMLCISIMKPPFLEGLKRIILSLGVNLSLLLLLGLFWNTTLPLIGYAKPLDTVPLLIGVNILVLSLSIIASVRNKDEKLLNSNYTFYHSEKLLLSISFLFPPMSILGTYLLNSMQINTLVFALLIFIAVCLLGICIYDENRSKRVYPIVILSISVSLVLLLGLRSNYVIGDDVQLEFFFFKKTLEECIWSINYNSSLDACLSISLLPTIYQSLLFVNPEYLYKILFPLLFSVSPLIIFVLANKYFNETYSLLAAFFFMSQRGFLWTAYYPRTNIAVLLFAFAILVLFMQSDLRPYQQKILFILFLASCTVSHYSTSYIAFGIVFFSAIGIHILSILSTKCKKKTIQGVFIAIVFFCFIYFWYSQINTVIFTSGVNFIDISVLSLHDLYLQEARGAPVQTLLGSGISNGIPYTLQFLFTWLSLGITLIGVCGTILAYSSKRITAKILKIFVDIEMLLFGIIALSISILAVLVPYISRGYGLERAYLITSIFLSIFFICGGVYLTKIITDLIIYYNRGAKESTTDIMQGKSFKRAQYIKYCIILVVLIPYFLCMSGAMHEIFGQSYQISLSVKGDQYNKLYVHDQEVVLVNWFSQKYAQGNKIYKDEMGNLPLRLGYLIENPYRSNYFTRESPDSGYILMRYQNVVEELIYSDQRYIPVREYYSVFSGKDQIYNNGGSVLLGSGLG